MADHLEVFHHVGLLIDEPPAPGLNETGRVALYFVFRLTELSIAFTGGTHLYWPSAFSFDIDCNRESNKNVAAWTAMF